MPYRYIEDRRKHYQRNKDEINKKRRERSKNPEIKKRIRENDRRWRAKNKEKLRIFNKIYHEKYRNNQRKLVFDHYGRKCICCGESNIKFLSIDHMKGKGTEHRKKINNHIHTWLIKNNFPKEFQILCFNCNWGKYYNNGICPHKNKIC